ncbi:hypothetical protein HN51_035470 [Arachis hypogaea]
MYSAHQLPNLALYNGLNFGPRLYPFKPYTFLAFVIITVDIHRNKGTKDILINRDGSPIFKDIHCHLLRHY